MAIKKFKIEASEQAKQLAKKPVKASDGEWDKAVISFIDTIPELPEQGKVISKKYKGFPVVIVGLGDGKCLYNGYTRTNDAASDVQFIRGLIKRGDSPEKATANLGFKTYTRGEVEGACGGKKKSVKSAAGKKRWGLYSDFGQRILNETFDSKREAQRAFREYGYTKDSEAWIEEVDETAVGKFDKKPANSACGGKKTVKSSAKKSVKCAADNADLERAKQNIVDGYNDEYDRDYTVDEYFKNIDLSQVPILYTTIGGVNEDEHDYQLYADLVDPKIIVEIDGDTVYEDKFPSIGDLADDLEDFDWQNWYSYYLDFIPDEILDGESVESACGGKKSVKSAARKPARKTVRASDDPNSDDFFDDLPDNDEPVDPKDINRLKSKLAEKKKFIQNLDLSVDTINQCMREYSDWLAENYPNDFDLYYDKSMMDKYLDVFSFASEEQLDAMDKGKFSNYVNLVRKSKNYFPDVKASCQNKKVKASKRSRSVKAASADGYDFAFYRDGYRVLTKTENNRGKWLAQKDNEEPFEITYEQARGFEPIDPRNRALQMKLGKALKLPIRSSAVKAAKKDNMNKEAHKWYNISLTKDEYAKFRKFLKENGYKYEPSEEGQNTYVKVYLTKADADKVNKFLDSMDDVESACGGKKSKKIVKASAAAKRRAKKSVKASKYYEITDHYTDEVGRADTEDEARELAKKLIRENDVDHYDIFWVDTDPDSTDDTSYIDTVYADKPFSVEGYYEANFRGLADSDTFYELRDALEYAQELLSKGISVRMECENAGGILEITPDEYDEFMTTDPEYFEDLPKLAEWLMEVRAERMDSRQEPWLDNWQYNTDIGMSVKASEGRDYYSITDDSGEQVDMADTEEEAFEKATEYLEDCFEGFCDWCEIVHIVEGPNGEAIEDYIDTIEWTDVNSPDIDASTNVKAALGNKNKTDYASNPIYELDKYVKDLAEGVAAAAGITLTYQVSDEAITFIDGDGTAVFIQPISEITPEPDDLENDIQELVSAIQYEDSDNPEYWPTDTTEDDPDYATRAVQMSVDDELEPVMGEGEDIGYGIDSYGETIDESTVDELYRMAERDILPKTELAKLDPDVSIDKDSWDFYFGGISNTGMMGVVKFYIHFKMSSDDINLNDYILPEAGMIPDFKYYSADLDFDIYTENGVVKDVVLEDISIYTMKGDYDEWDSVRFKDNFNVEAICNYVEKLAAPAAEEIYNAVSNL